MASRAVGNDHTAWCNNEWHAEKEKLGKNDLDAQEREELLYTLTNNCTTMMRDKRGVVGDVARTIGVSLVAPPIDPAHIQQYFGYLKGFGAVDELVMIVTGGAPVHAAATGVDLERALQYGNHPSVNEHLKFCQQEKTLRRSKTTQMLSDIKISCARNPPSKSVPDGGRSDAQGQDHKRFIV